MNNAAQRVLSLDDYRLYYEQNGYVVLPGQISEALIDSFMAYFKRDILHRRPSSIDKTRMSMTAIRFTDHGHVIQSFLDVHNYKRFPEFRQAALDIFFSPAMLQGLAQTSGHARHNLMQSMLFDANAATPASRLVVSRHRTQRASDGVWLALEDIREEAGRFYVLPGSHNVKLHEPDMPHSAWLVKMRDFLERNRDMVHAPALKKATC